MFFDGPPGFEWQQKVRACCCSLLPVLLAAALISPHLTGAGAPFQLTCTACSLPLTAQAVEVSQRFASPSRSPGRLHSPRLGSPPRRRKKKKVAKKKRRRPPPKEVQVSARPFHLGSVSCKAASHLIRSNCLAHCTDERSPGDSAGGAQAGGGAEAEGCT